MVQAVSWRATLANFLTRINIFAKDEEKLEEEMPEEVLD